MNMHTASLWLRYIAFAILLTALIKQRPPTWTIIVATLFVLATVIVDILNAKNRR